MPRFETLRSRRRVRLCLESLENRLNPAAIVPELPIGPMPSPSLPVIQLDDETPIFLPAPVAAPSASAAPDVNAALLNAMHVRSPAFAPFSVDFISAANHVTPQFVGAVVPATLLSATSSTIFVAAQTGEDLEREDAPGSALFGVGGNADDASVTARRPHFMSEEADAPRAPVTPKKSPEPAEAEAEDVEQLCV